MGKIYLFKDQEDFVINLTDDDIINVIGTKGSGKTTFSIRYINDDNYIVVNCDRLFDLPCNEKEDKELINIRKILNDKYGKLNMNEDFTNCYNDIVEYILNKHKIGLIEGNVIQDMDVFDLKGKIIIKRTGSYKSYKRAVKRDYKNEYFMNLEKEKHKYLYKATRLYKIRKRRKSVFKQAKDIEQIMNKLENNSNINLIKRWIYRQKQINREALIIEDRNIFFLWYIINRVMY